VTGRGAEAADVPSAEFDDHQGARGRVRRRRNDPPPADHQGAGDIGNPGDDEPPPLGPPRPAASATPARRSKRVYKEFNPEDLMAEVLDVCVQQTCGMPSSSPLVSAKPSVSATLVAHDESKSRAIVLRYGAGKRDVSIIWVSPRGGFLCSCFGGTQNALILAASSRSTRCKHTKLLEASLSNTGVSRELFRAHMMLPGDAPEYAVGRAFGTSYLWIVLYRSVYSIVTFTAANAATCIAPGCRRFRGRCGHVRVGRMHRTKFLDGGGKEETTGRIIAASAAKKPVTAEQRAAALVSGDEDEGVEKQPSDTLRSDRDPEESTVAARVPRNLLPCVAEVEDGDIWARTADWGGIQLRLNAENPGEPTGAAKMCNAILEESCRRGLARDIAQPLIEPFCGSCGTKRAADARLTEEPAVLYTHHPTAPPIKVCAHVLGGLSGSPATGSCPSSDGLLLSISDSF